MVKLHWKVPFSFLFAFCPAIQAIDGGFGRPTMLSPVALALTEKRPRAALCDLSILLRWFGTIRLGWTIKVSWIKFIWSNPCLLGSHPGIRFVLVPSTFDRTFSLRLVVSSPATQWGVICLVAIISSYSARIIPSCSRRPCTLYQTFRSVCIFEPFDDPCVGKKYEQNTGVRGYFQFLISGSWWFMVEGQFLLKSFDCHAALMSS